MATVAPELSVEKHELNFPKSRGLLALAARRVLRVEQLDKVVIEEGIRAGAEFLVGKKRDVVYEGNANEVGQALGRGALIIATHGNITGPLTLIASLPAHSEKISAMVSAHLAGTLGQETQRYCLPLSTDAAPGTRERNWLFRRMRPPSLPEEERVSLRSRSFEEAKRRIEAGGVVLLFPDGAGKRRNREWGKGIGRLVVQLSPDTPIVMAGIKQSHPLQLIPGIRKLLPKARVILYSPRTVGEFTSTQDHDAARRQLRQAYEAL